MKSSIATCFTKNTANGFGITGLGSPAIATLGYPGGNDTDREPCLPTCGGRLTAERQPQLRCLTGTTLAPKHFDIVLAD